MAIALVLKPHRVYDHHTQKHRELGTSPESTLMPLWVITGLVSVLSYAAATFFTNNSSTLPDTPGAPVGSTPPSHPHTPPTAPHAPPFTAYMPPSHMPEPHSHMYEPHSHMHGQPTHITPQAVMSRSRVPSDNRGSSPLGANVDPNVPPENLQFANRRRTMAGGGSEGFRGASWRLSAPRQRGGGIDTRFARHADGQRHHQALRDSRVWNRVMT